MSERTVEDRLREEYFALLPESRRLLEELEAEVRHCLLPLSSSLDRYEKIEVNSRVKDCESALGALRRRQEFATFDPDRADSYTLTSLNDLAGVRVLAFPRSRWREANDTLRHYALFSSWTSDPIPSDEGSTEPLAFKYHGFCSRNTKLRAELQVVPMLTGLFWEVEHAAIYKPSPQLKGVLASLEMQRPIREVYRALGIFEAEFERLVRSAPLDKP
jgi:hypothetical protein